jgi:hypothetical protein
VRGAALLLALLAGCRAAAPAAHPGDPKLALFGHAGDIAYQQERPDVAATEYRVALARARERDDGAAIADAGFDLATAELRADRPREAMTTAGGLKAELARRGMVDPAFDLLLATAMFRLDDLADADRLAAGLSDATDPALVNAAWFLRGLIADARGDRRGLQRAYGALGSTADPADIAELRARLTLDSAQARRAADLRRDELDYRGMARVLALAARGTRDDAEAADLYLRAGRSAAARGDTGQARVWLDQARARAPNEGLRDEADAVLRDLHGR